MGPGPRAGPFAPDRRDWLRLAGGLVFAAGAIALALRKESDWGDWALFFVFAIPCAALYALAFAGRRDLPRLQGWQSAYFVFASLLLPLALLEFVDAVGGDAGAELNLTWVFGIAAAVAALTSLRGHAWWQMLLAGVYAIVAWLALWDKILDNPSASTIRWLLIVFAVGLIAAAVVAARAGRPQAADLVTTAGIAAVVAGAISFAGLAGAAANVGGLLGGGGAAPSEGWNVYLLAVSLLLIAFGVRAATRGPAYVGALGLVAFIVLVGQNVGAVGDDRTSVVGWPLLLLLIGAAIMVASFALPLRPGGVTTEPPRGGAVSATGTPPASPIQPGAPAERPREPGAPPPPPPPA